MLYITRLSNWVGITAISSFAGTSATNFASNLIGSIVAVSTLGGLVVILVTSSYFVTRKRHALEERRRIANESALRKDQRRIESSAGEFRDKIAEELRGIRKQILVSKEKGQLRDLYRRARLLRDSVSPGGRVHQEIEDVLQIIEESLGAKDESRLRLDLPELIIRSVISDNVSHFSISGGLTGLEGALLKFVGVGTAVGVSLGYLVKWLL